MREFSPGDEQHPVLWTFRRCPYAMRARLALLSAGKTVELREILLRAKPAAFLEVSASATVPALRVGQQVFDESLDIMTWALGQNDPEQLLDMPQDGWDIISTNDGPFKQALDHTKYASRYPERDALAERGKAADILMNLEDRFDGAPWLFGQRPKLADLAILPFVRQFANTDLAWFEAQEWPNVRSWLHRFVTSETFDRIMCKYQPWSDGAAPIWFGSPERSSNGLTETYADR
ncbi:MAG: glutathione S-transferase [Pseudomonadota bacterium]